MRPSEALTLYGTQIREIALRHRVSAVRVFGSALHGDDTAESDLDLLVDMPPNCLPAGFRDQVLREAMAVYAARTRYRWQTRCSTPWKPSALLKKCLAGSAALH